MAAVETSSIFRQPKIVDKAFTLPLVSDTYTYGKDEFSHIHWAFLYEVLTHYIIEANFPSVTTS